MCLGEESPPWGTQSSNRWEDKPEGQERKSAGLSLRLSEVSQNIIAHCALTHGPVAELYISVVDRHKHCSAQKSCAGFELSWGCKDPWHPHRIEKDVS